MKKNIRKLKRQIAWLIIFSFLASVAPLVVAVALRWDNYITQPSDAVKLSMGGIAVVIIIFLKAIGKLKMPEKRVLLYLFVLVLCYLLAAIINDIIFLLGMATLGEAVDLVVFQQIIKSKREKLQLEKTGDAVGEKLETIVQKYLGDKK